MRLPPKWKVMRVDEAGEVQGGRQRSPTATGLPRPYLRVANVYDDYIDFEDVKNMPFRDQEFTRFSLEDGDILLNEGQSLELVGRSAIYRGPSGKHAFQNTLIRFRCGPSILPEAAQLIFQTALYTGRFAAIASRTTSIAHLGVERLAGLTIAVPPIEEQKSIIRHLAWWGQATCLAEKNLHAAQARRCGLMQQLLTGKRRFRGHSDPWRSVHLGNLFHERSENNRTGLPLLSITGNEGVIPRCEDRKDTSSEDKSKYLRICPGDIGYNTMRMWQGVCGLSRHEGILSPAYTVVIPGSQIDGEFAAIYFKFPPIINLFRRHSQGLVDDTLNLKFHHFAQIKVTIPPIDEQRAIAKVLGKSDAEISVLERLAAAYREQKKGLMQQLLTGKRRVKVQAA